MTGNLRFKAGGPTRGHDEGRLPPRTIAVDTVHQDVWREVIGRFASGVTIITTTVGDKDYGTTASAVSSLSMEPPMLLVCLNETSETQRAIRDAGRFVVNILGEGQGDLAYRFATKSASKFAGVRLARGKFGVPEIVGSLARIQCRVAEAVRGGTHTVFLGEVEAASAIEGSPLTYFRGQFGRFEEALQDAAYRRLRAMVLRRALPIGEPLDPDSLAGQLDVELPHLYYGLTRLTSDGLLDREPGRGYVIKPLDATTADQALEARGAIEIGVVEHAMAKIGGADVDELRRHAESACAAVQRDEPNVRVLRTASRAFHEKLVSLMGNEILLDVYRRLGIDAIWARALTGTEGPPYISPEYLVELADACERHDVETAKRLIAEHTEEVRGIAARAIARVGGAI
jgi:flavin reductase (DIM6/NTAB) family NADH-FMN oxidoreductase RutF/DNA-binding GntR family transcriptional regulator